MSRKWVSTFVWLGRGWVVGGLVLLFAAPVLVGQVLPPTGSPLLPAAVQQGADVISTFTLVGHGEGGRRKWEVQGETADLLSETVHLSPVKATNFGKVDVHLTADQGDFNKLTRDVHLEGRVVATTSDGARLTTRWMDWSQEREMGTTTDWLKVTREGMEVTGQGGVGYPKLKRVRVERQVTVTLTDAAGKTVITADGPMEVDYGRERARFWRGVLVRDAQGTVQSDRLDVLLDPKTRQMKKAIFWGHVRINHGGQMAHANRAEYWQSEGHVRLGGHPKLLVVPEGDLVGP